MSDQPVKTVVPNVVARKAEVVSALPWLSGLDSQVQIILHIKMMLCDLKVPKAVGVRILGKGVTPEDVDEAVNQVLEAFAVHQAQLAEEINQKTRPKDASAAVLPMADPKKPVRPVVEKRLELEMSEQGTNVADAQALVQWVVNISSTLGVPYTDPKATAPAGGKPKGNPAAIDALKAVVRVFVTIDEGHPPAQAPVEEKPSWLTNRALDLGEDADTIEVIKATMSAYQTLELQKAGLENQGYDQPFLSGLFTRIMVKASKQLELSPRITENVSLDVQKWLTDLTAMEAFAAEIAAVDAYLNPAA